MKPSLPAVREVGEVDTARGDIIAIFNQGGHFIGALTGEPGTGVERVLEALRAYVCPDHPEGGCIRLSRYTDTIMAIFPTHLRAPIEEVVGKLVSDP